MHIFDFGNAMANHRQVVSRRNSQTNCFLEPVAGKNRAHVQIVGHDEIAELEFITQQICDDPARQAGRSFRRLKAWIPAVTDHHAVRVFNEFAKDGQLIPIKLLLRAIDSGQLIMSIEVAAE